MANREKASEPEPRYYCNKCGFWGGWTRHARPGTVTECPYIAVASQAAPEPQTAPDCGHEGCTYPVCSRQPQTAPETEQPCAHPNDLCAECLEALLKPAEERIATLEKALRDVLGVFTAEGFAKPHYITNRLAHLAAARAALSGERPAPKEGG